MSCGLGCLSDRKLYRKELSKWRGTLVNVVAFEDIALQLSEGGSRKRRTSTIVTSGGREQTADFDPEEKCVVCQDRLNIAPATAADPLADRISGMSRQPKSASSSHPFRGMPNVPQPNPFFQHYLLQQYELFAQFYLQNIMSSQMQVPPPYAPPLFGPDWPAFGSPSPSIGDTTKGLIFPPGMVMPHGSQGGSTPNGKRNAESTKTLRITTGTAEGDAKPSGKEATDHSPLDLSRKTGLDTVDMEGAIPRPASLRGVAKARRAAQAQAVVASEDPPKDTSTNTEPEKNGNTKRNYSQIDLDAAVNDIRCGRLGTRRASVVYGIPRSTLRNKIYKLEAAEEQAGVPTRFKRRRPGGQSAAEKKLSAEALMKKKKMQQARAESKSPVSHSRSSSPDVKVDIVCSPTETARTSDDPEKDGSVDGTASGAELAGDVWQWYLKTQTQDLLSMDIDEDDQKMSTTADKEWKKQRPKRGQYRKYDKVALDEAVQSVRRGEMSVHRAGSFYGVPHSTLEYKVKERNLMRAKRKKEDDEGSATPPSISPIPSNNFLTSTYAAAATVV